MRFVIDTHCWLCAVSAPEKLRPSAAEWIANREHTVVFSAVSALEIAIKTSLGKLQLPEPPAAFVTSRVESLAMTSLPIYLTHALHVAELPKHHGDPFDRLLIAQCRIEGLPLMTADAAIPDYDIDVLWAGRGRAPRGARLPG
jgi:PIN domain nuclease of toxin-antitoxin system